MSRKSIVWVSPITLDTQVYREFLLNTLKQLTELGHNTSLIAIRSKYKYQNEDPRIRVFPVPLREIPVISPVIYTIILSLYLPIYIIKMSPDFVIYDPNIAVLSSIPSILISKFKKTNFVLDVRSVPVETIGVRGFLYKFWFSESVLIAKKLFNGLTIITPLMREEVCSRFGIDPKKVGVWTCGASPVLFNPKDYISQSVELKQKLGLSEKFVVFYHGSFSATRGIIETIKAMKTLTRKFPDVVLFLLGNGPIIDSMNELIQTEELQDKVIIHPPVPQTDVPKFICMSNVCISPLKNNSFWRYQCPVKILEYLAMEKVIIATDIPAHRSIINKEKCVIYMDSAEPDEIAKAIKKARENKEKLEAWGKSGRTIILENYTMEKVVRDLENYLLSIAGNTPADKS